MFALTGLTIMVPGTADAIAAGTRGAPTDVSRET
jgi:hypothetical protein